VIGTQSWQTGNSNAIRFGTPINDSGNYGFPMSILRDGNVGIGTTSPVGQFQIQGNSGSNLVTLLTSPSGY
jgi:hypothetical protein